MATKLTSPRFNDCMFAECVSKEQYSLCYCSIYTRIMPDLGQEVADLGTNPLTHCDKQAEFPGKFYF